MNLNIFSTDKGQYTQLLKIVLTQLCFFDYLVIASYKEIFLHSCSIFLPAILIIPVVPLLLCDINGPEGYLNK